MSCSLTNLALPSKTSRKEKKRYKLKKSITQAISKLIQRNPQQLTPFDIKDLIYPRTTISTMPVCVIKNKLYRSTKTALSFDRS